MYGNYTFYQYTYHTVVLQQQYVVPVRTTAVKAIAIRTTVAHITTACLLYSGTWYCSYIAVRHWYCCASSTNESVVAAQPSDESLRSALLSLPQNTWLLEKCALGLRSDEQSQGLGL